MHTLVLNGKELTLEALYDIAYKGRKVEIAPEAYERLKKGRFVMEKLAREGKPIYGFNRGVGWNKDRGFEEDFIGESEVSYQGEVVNAGNAMEKEGISPYKLELKDGHSIILSNSQGETVTAILVKETEDLLKMANLIYCLDYEGLNGNLESLREDVNALRGIPGQSDCAAECRKYLEGSYLNAPHPDRALQDSLTFRGGFSINGTVMDALRFSKKYLSIQINSPSDNPCIILEDEQTYVTSNFETTTLAVGVEMLAIALSHMSKSICYRMIKMTDPNFTNLTRFLAPWDNSSLGYATIQNTFTALDIENRMLVNPSSVDFYPMEGMIEDHGSNLPLAANKAMAIIDNLRYLVGIEGLYAAQAVDLRENVYLGRYTKEAYKTIRQVIPFLSEDRNMHIEIQKIYELIRSKELLRRINELDNKESGNK